MKKYFICSDTHSYYSILMEALKEKGFDINNQDHIFVLVGDLFDRGKESLELYNWVKSLPLERRILIRGNHEYLFKDMVKRGYAESHDIHNGTIDTLYQLNEWDDKKETHDYYKQLYLLKDDDRKWTRLENNLYKKRKACFSSNITTEVVNWFDSDEWVNYWETPNYIFTHGFIPLHWTVDWPASEKYGYIVKVGLPTYREDWRNATQTEWEDSTWFNWSANYMAVKKGCNETGKYIAVGHWHTSDLYKYLDNKSRDIYDCPIYKSKKYKVIGLDACTAGSGKINILVLDEKDC